MANERKTENLVRKLLAQSGYTKNKSIVLEEQASDNPKIDKILSSASKKGTGKGFPEFIISFENNPDNIVVIECKASNKYHESETRKKYSQYAVDGVLLYASYLKSAFNVMAIAVSGETEKELKISHFLWLKDNYTYMDVSDKHMLTPESLFNVIKEQAEPFKEEELIKKAIEYNEELHSHSIPEAERCTLISAILVALQHKPFLQSYKSFYNEETKKPENKELIESLMLACRSVLKRNKISDDKAATILYEYGKINQNKVFSSDTRTEKHVEKPNTVLRDLIKKIEADILPYINSNIFDVLGQFYTQFIRYAGSDTKTGLVLTPPHITDFFCEIAGVTQDDIILDPCCGTGGFLVSAMKYMLKDAGSNESKQSSIKSTQLIGIETRADMFSHACSNMMMRGDGKSHIYNDSCFNNSIKQEIIDQKPTKTFLNPPYDVGEDGQLEFIENALDMIVKDGIGVAICQMSTVVSNKKGTIAVRERLLNKHTLEAVFSMPDELFYPVGVVTCILVFRAHTPHSRNKETFFGYYKDDSFTKVKHKGRIDNCNKWNGIKEKWLDAYINRRNIAGISVTQKVTAKDEWCAEAYMETDYSQLSSKDFVKTIKNYVVYRFLNEDIEQLYDSRKPQITSKVELGQRTWKPFIYSKIFKIKKGKRLIKEQMSPGETPYIGAIDSNNGCREYIDSSPIHKENSIVVNYNGSVAEAFYQPIPFWASDDCNILYSPQMNQFNALFLCTIIRMEKYRFSYGRKWHVERMKESMIKLPVDSKGNPDWQFMEDYIKSLPCSSNLK